MAGSHAEDLTDLPPPYRVPEGSELELKAPNRHQKRLRMLAQMPRGGRCAEIGVWNGAFSDYILEVTRPRELILIDPWDLLSDRPDGEQTHKKHSDDAFMGSMRDHVAAKFAERPEVKLHQGFSAEVLEGLPDDHLDWIYIDGNHLYDFVKQDLAVAARKVRQGGVIAGDDLFWKRDGRMHVREAVMEFLEEAGLERKVDHIGQQFMIPVVAEIKKTYAAG
ncbi:class I SAM-dependent methyltransferase [Acidimangrovimonas sediminis]|uniref:class I SAM-dependent methyltransferase n=1 Tax=Acidimangrovimonas sediminis TaxID=2056283 RepID=UPI000C7FE42A|nr:class I SAM-dependent methyltransferase [Acidimangrovimonas sediminis]